MKLIPLTACLALALPFSSVADKLADKPKVNRDQIAKMEEAIDKRLSGIFPVNDPAEVVGLTQGMYITGYGAVFAGTVNLVPTGRLSPFHPTMSKDDIARVHQKKLERVAKLREVMQQILVSSAASLDPVPDNEQITVGISLFYWRSWEDTNGLPAQIVMHAPKRVLVRAKSGSADGAALNAAITTEEF